VDSTIGLSNVATVVELGARDCAESADFSSRLPHARIYSFECNPATLPVCRRVAAGLPNVTLVEKAVTDRNGKVSFYPIDQSETATTWKDGNPGASSLLVASGKYPVETYVQREIKVEATTLSSYMDEAGLESIDLLWMDIQGAELMALRGLGSHLRDVKVVISEVEFFEIYRGQPLFRDIRAALRAAGFRLHAFAAYGRFSADAIFINRRAVASMRMRAVLDVRDLAMVALHGVRSAIGHRSRVRGARRLFRRFRKLSGPFPSRVTSSGPAATDSGMRDAS
jgi:FkbM family methyltransferase